MEYKLKLLNDAYEAKPGPMFSTKTVTTSSEFKKDETTEISYPPTELIWKIRHNAAKPIQFIATANQTRIELSFLSYYYLSDLPLKNARVGRKMDMSSILWIYVIKLTKCRI